MGGWFTRFCNDSRQWDGPYPRWFADSGNRHPGAGTGPVPRERLRRSGGPGWSCT